MTGRLPKGEEVLLILRASLHHRSRGETSVEGCLW